jgi:dTDP-glucose 4,6-dehydratase
VGGRAERKNIDVVQGVCEALDRLRPRADGKAYAELIAFVTDRPGHDFRYAIDCRRIEEELGWAQTETFESGLLKTVAWFLDNEPWWRTILARTYTGERLGLKQP